MERLEAFDKEHGGDGVVFRGMVYFADGATRSNHPRATLFDPPKDPLARARNVQVYWEHRRKWARLEFNKLKQRLEQDVYAASKGLWTAPSDEQIAELEALQKKVKRVDQEYEVACAAVKKLHPQLHVSPGAQRARAMHEDAVRRANARIKAIEI